MIEVDPTVLAKPEDDAYASSGYDTSTQSLTSSVQQYVLENGRKYHSYYGTDKYFMPADETEQERLDLHHEIFRLSWEGKLHEAPLTAPNRILDIGTGTGIWAIDMADNFPMAEVVGTDLIPIQPSWVPTNCRFEVDDATKEWTFKNDSFDFVHSRNISSGVSDWNHLISEMKRCTTPGGYVELCENSLFIQCDDGTMKEDHGIKVFAEYLRVAMTKMGRVCVDLPFLKALLEDAGFEDVHAIEIKEPMGPWPKDLRLKKVGAMSLLNAKTGFESYGLAAFTRVLGMDVNKARELCKTARLAAQNKNYHIYSPHLRVYGRKPTVGTASQ